MSKWTINVEEILLRANGNLKKNALESSIIIIIINYTIIINNNYTINAKRNHISKKVSSSNAIRENIRK
jgi:hypothetical protein